MLFTIQAPSIDPLRIEDVCHVKSQRLALNDTSTDTSKWNRHPGMMNAVKLSDQTIPHWVKTTCLFLHAGLFLHGCLCSLCPLSNQFIVPTTHHLTVYIYIYIHTYIYDYICVYIYISLLYIYMITYVYIYCTIYTTWELSLGFQLELEKLSAGFSPCLLFDTASRPRRMKKGLNGISVEKFMIRN